MGCGGISTLLPYVTSRIGICKLFIIICCIVAAGIIGKHFTENGNVYDYYIVGDVSVDIKFFEFVLFATIWS